MPSIPIAVIPSVTLTQVMTHLLYDSWYGTYVRFVFLFDLRPLSTLKSERPVY